MQIITSLLREGILIRFAPGTLFGNEKSHFGVVLNSEYTSGVVVVYATSNIDGNRRFARIRALNDATIVCMAPGTNRHFGKMTAFDCNRPALVSLITLSQWHSKGQIEISSHDFMLPPPIVQDIKAGVYISELVEDTIRNLL